MIWHKQQLFLKVDAAQVGLGWEENELSHQQLQFLPR